MSNPIDPNRISYCSMYLMVEPWDVHAVMTFGQAFAFALVVWFIDKYPEDRRCPM